MEQRPSHAERGCAGRVVSVRWACGCMCAQSRVPRRAESVRWACAGRALGLWLCVHRRKCKGVGRACAGRVQSVRLSWHALGMWTGGEGLSAIAHALCVWRACARRALGVWLGMRRESVCWACAGRVVRCVQGAGAKARTGIGAKACRKRVLGVCWACAGRVLGVGVGCVHGGQGEPRGRVLRVGVWKACARRVLGVW